jgi:hypothetical protein
LAGYKVSGYEVHFRLKLTNLTWFKRESWRHRVSPTTLLVSRYCIMAPFPWFVRSWQKHHIIYHDMEDILKQRSLISEWSFHHQGSGLSSSSAIVCSAALAAAHANGVQTSKVIIIIIIIIIMISSILEGFWFEFTTSICCGF